MERLRVDLEAKIAQKKNEEAMQGVLNLQEQPKKFKNRPIPSASQIPQLQKEPSKAMMAAKENYTSLVSALSVYRQSALAALDADISKQRSLLSERSPISNQSNQYFKADGRKLPL